MASEQAFIEARQDRYRQLHNSLDAEAFVKLFSDNVDYSDHGIGVEHINKEAVAELARSVFGSFSSLVFTTVSVNGTRNFTAWEWTAEGVLSAEMPGVPLKRGEVGRMMGVSLFWWDMEGVPEGEDGKIKKEAEYSKLLA